MIDPSSPDFANTPVSPLRSYYSYQPADPAAPPAVTILTPFYNTGEVFRETAQSVLQQSFQQWEWLIVNDGSTDETALRILDEYRSSADPRIRVIDMPANVGPSAVRNAGYQAARTEYVVQFDSDDLLEPTAIEKWLWFLVSHPEFAFVKGYSTGFDAQEYLWHHKGFHRPDDFLIENSVDPTSMVRKSTHQAAGGYDASNRDGLEDWDFWLRCADVGLWGATIPEYLNWYRRRPSHNDRWSTWDVGEVQRNFEAGLREKYARLWRDGMPHIQPRPHIPLDQVPEMLPCRNLLAKNRPRLLLILPHMVLGGADKFNLDLTQLMVEQHGYEVTIAATLPNDSYRAPVFADYTPDIFILHHFLKLVDHPRFLQYLIKSRQIDTVLITHSSLGYQLLPYLRAHCPGVTFMDYLHIEEEYWNNGGYPRESLNHQEQLDLTAVTSQHLKDWMVERGGDAQRIEVCTINVDTQDWNPARFDRPAIRRALGVEEGVALLLYAGRLCAQKQPQVFAEVMLQLSERGSPFAGLVAGDGPDRAWLEDFLQRNGLTNIRLLGPVSHQRMRELMAASDIFFLPSKMEGISLAIYEAMSMGVVVVGADVGGQRELLTSDCGFLVEHNSDEIPVYLEVLSKLLADPELRAQMGKAARHRVQENYRLEDMGRRMLELMRRAQELAQTAPRPVAPLELAQTIATNTIEHTRMSRLADQLWNERETVRKETEQAEKLLREQRDWTQELERGKTWHEEEHTAWRSRAERENDYAGRLLQEIEAKNQEIARLEHELVEIKSTKLQRLKHAILFDKLTLRKPLKIAYLLTALATPSPIRRRFKPQVEKAKKTFQSAPESDSESAKQIK